jgi:hypothetical protein
MAARTTRALWPWAARANASPNASFTANSAEEASLRLLDYLDFGIISVNPQMRQGPISGLFN